MLGTTRRISQSHAHLIFMLVLFLQSLLIAAVYASTGDRAPEFEECLLFCDSRECSSSSPSTLSFALRFTKWTCLDNCKYECMHEITTKSIASGDLPVQYYGKWPFWRLAGMQEPASVLFSVLNLWAHLQGYSKIYADILHSHPLKLYYLVWSVVNMNTWVWSAVFHTRDTSLTEKLDYFSATLTVLITLYFTVLRFYLCQLSTLQPQTFAKNLGLRAWTTVCAAVYTGHVLYLSFLPHFDYQYNIIINVIFGFSHNVLWLLYSLPASMSLLKRYPDRPKTYRPRIAGKAATLVLLTTLATALELFDFSPWKRVLDAHSLWHLATVPITHAWYRFLILDASDPSWKKPQE